MSKILSSFWGIVFYIRNRTLLGSTTKKNATQVGVKEGVGRAYGLGFRVVNIIRV